VGQVCHCSQIPMNLIHLSRSYGNLSKSQRLLRRAAVRI